MKLIFSSKTKDFTPSLQEKFSAKLLKISKLVERRGEREAHVMHQVQRHLHKVEVVVNFYNHALIGEGSDADLDKALVGAATNLEKQVLKMRNRWRDTHRDAKSVRSNKESWESPEPVAAPVPKGVPAKSPAKVKAKANGNNRAPKPKIYKVNYGEDRKPMSLEEAILEMDSDVNYFVYMDAKRDCLAVLVRRTDGHLDLIES
jgi:putative sigma-54 modulation protein